MGLATSLYEYETSLSLYETVDVCEDGVYSGVPVRNPWLDFKPFTIVERNSCIQSGDVGRGGGVEVYL